MTLADLFVIHGPALLKLFTRRRNIGNRQVIPRLVTGRHEAPHFPNFEALEFMVFNSCHNCGSAPFTYQIQVNPMDWFSIFVKPAQVD